MYFGLTSHSPRDAPSSHPSCKSGQAADSKNDKNKGNENNISIFFQVISQKKHFFSLYAMKISRKFVLVIIYQPKPTDQTGPTRNMAGHNCEDFERSFHWHPNLTCFQHSNIPAFPYIVPRSKCKDLTLFRPAFWGLSEAGALKRTVSNILNL